MGTIQIDGSTPKLTIGNATAEDATILFDGAAQDFYIALDDSADDLLIGLGRTVGTTPIISIDENKLSTFSGAITVGVDDTGHDVKLFGASAGSYALWDESANLLDLRGATAAGPGNLKLTTGELTVVDADVLGKIEFQAPLESSGTDAILVGASIYAEADDTFAAGVNNTDLVFALGKSEAAAEKFRFTADTEIGIGGANYGTDGQVLTSGGAGAACAWEDAAGFDVSSITGATALAETPADTDELVISDGGTLKRLDFSHLFNRPAFMANQAGAGQTISDDTITKLTYDTENFDTDGKFASSTFTPTVAGYYWVFANLCLSSPAANTKAIIAIKKNGVSGNTNADWSWGMNETVAYSTEICIRTSGLIYLDSDDYVEVAIKQNSGASKDTLAARSYFGAWRMNI